ncbi:hypothetical protein V8F06_014898 [Rhypophila decipiens]
MRPMRSPEEIANYTGDPTKNTVRDQYQNWDQMVLSVWPVVTVMINTTFDPDLPADGLERARKGRKLAGWGTRAVNQVHCIAPNGVGTADGKAAFTFSGETPGTPPPPPPEESSAPVAGDDDKNDGARGIVGASGLVSLILAAWAAWLVIPMM